jgi:streptogramin lyase
MPMPRLRRWLNPRFSDPTPGRRPPPATVFRPRLEDLEARLLLSIYEFPASRYASPVGITAGPDGNLWFTERDANRIGVMSPDGTLLAEYQVPTSNSAPEFIVAGPDGNVWFTEWRAGKIARITPDGAITEFPTPTPNSAPTYITAGPDGNLWYTEYYASQIGVITPDGDQAEFPLPTDGAHPIGITSGPDGNLWFTEFAANAVGSISPDGGTINEYPLYLGGRQPLGITTGPDGNLWFAEYNYPDSQIGTIAPDGTGLTEYAMPLPNADVEALTTGPDGNLWFTDANNNQIGSITTDGTINLYPTSRGSAPLGITLGPSGNDLWFTEIDGNMIGEVVFDGSPSPGGMLDVGKGMDLATTALPDLSQAAAASRSSVAGHVPADLSLSPGRQPLSTQAATHAHRSPAALTLENQPLFDIAAGTLE